MVVVSGNSMTGDQYMKNFAGKSFSGSTLNRLGLDNLNATFKKVDANDDGLVSEKEFKNHFVTNGSPSTTNSSLSNTIISSGSTRRISGSGNVNNVTVDGTLLIGQ